MCIMNGTNRHSPHNSAPRPLSTYRLLAALEIEVSEILQGAVYNDALLSFMVIMYLFGYGYNVYLDLQLQLPTARIQLVGQRGLAQTSHKSMCSENQSKTVIVVTCCTQQSI